MTLFLQILMVAYPPTVGDVTGDGYMEILCGVSNEDGWGDIGHAYVNIYDKNFDLIDFIDGDFDGKGQVWEPRVFDCDSDGYNELIVSTTGGYIFCYDTQAPVSDPAPRTWVNFYSEYRAGAAEYVEPPGPKPPVIKNELPLDNSEDISLNPLISVEIYDFQHDIFDVTFEINGGSSWQTVQTYASQSVTSFTTFTANTNGYANEYDTEYDWRVTVDDSKGNTNQQIFSFTTKGQNIPNEPNDFTATSYNSTVIDLSWTKDLMTDTTYIERNTSQTWTMGEGIEVYNDTGINHRDSNLNEDTIYYYQSWSYNQTDHTISSTYAEENGYTANQPPIFAGETPVDNSINIDISQNLVQVHISDPEGDLINWTIEGQYLYNTGQNLDIDGVKTANIITSLPYDTTIIWFVNTTDGYNWIRETYSFTTKSVQTNHPPVFSEIIPINGATQVPINISSLNVTIEDSDGDSFDWTIETSPNIGNASGFNDLNGPKSCNILGLNYSTLYTWFVNATDGRNWLRRSYSFMTETTPENNSFLFSEVTPSDGSKNVNIYPSCSVTIHNLFGDMMEVKFYENTTGSWILQETKHNVSSGSNVILNNYSNASDYSTNYWWKIYVSDENYSYDGKIYYFTTKKMLQSVVYVDDDFDSSTNGWQITHFDMIQDGINAAAEHGEIYVYNGVYYENILINKSINLIGENKDTTIIDGNGSGNIINISDDEVNVTGFTICFSGNSQSNSGIYVTSNFNTIILNNIENNKNGILIKSSSHNNVTNNNITYNKYCGIQIDHSNFNDIYENDVSDNQGYGFLLMYSSDNVISANTIKYNDFHISIVINIINCSLCMIICPVAPPIHPRDRFTSNAIYYNHPVIYNFLTNNL